MQSKLWRRFQAFRYERALARINLPEATKVPNLDGRLPGHWSALGLRAQKAYTLEFRREMAVPHPLADYKQSAWAVASCDGNDDTLLWDFSRPEQFFRVHLTWGGKPDQFPDRYPSWVALSVADMPDALDH